MKDRTIGVLFVAGAVVAYALAFNNSPPEAAAVAATPPSVEDPHTRLVRTVRSEAKYAAQEIIGKRLKAPSQAKFVTKELVEASENFALVYLEVDAPNSFGVRLRQSYCVVLNFDPPTGETYRWSNVMGVVSCEHGSPDEDTRYALKLANGWPNLGEPPQGFAARAEKPRRHRR